jgi:hypothetical protein
MSAIWIEDMQGEQLILAICIVKSNCQTIVAYSEDGETLGVITIMQKKDEALIDKTYHAIRLAIIQGQSFFSVKQFARLQAGIIDAS